MTVLHRTGPRGAALVRVYALAGDRVGALGFAEALVRAARERGLRGATLVPALAGYGRHGTDTTLDTALYRPERQPLVLELVDDADALEAFVREEVAPRNAHGRLVTLERLQVVAYHEGSGPAGFGAGSEPG